jgi:hypothetical protein
VCHILSTASIHSHSNCREEIKKERKRKNKEKEKEKKRKRERKRAAFFHFKTTRTPVTFHYSDKASLENNYVHLIFARINQSIHQSINQQS